MIVVELSKQQALDADPKSIQQIILQQTQIKHEIQEFILFLKKQKKLFKFSQGTVKFL